MKYCFIINPAAGKSATKEGLRERILSVCAELGVDGIVLSTEKRGDACRFVAELRNKYSDEELRIYACGGDGTLNEVVNGVMALECRSGIGVGVLPVGTGNDFVRCFEPTEAFADIAAQIEAESIKIDLIRCNDLYAVNMINIGFDCQVVCKTAELKQSRFVPSSLAYIFGLAVTLVKKPWVRARLCADGKEHGVQERLLLTFANGGFCGGGFYSNPLSRLDDGCIDVLEVNEISRRRFISLVGSYKKGTHVVPKNRAILKSFKARSYKIDFEAPTAVSIDGEISIELSAELSCVRDAIELLVPRGARCMLLQSCEKRYAEV